MTKNGISDENLNKLFTHAQINLRDQDMVRNLSYLGINVLTDVSISLQILSAHILSYRLLFIHFEKCLSAPGHKVVLNSLLFSTGQS